MDAIVFLIDAADRDRFRESQTELNFLLTDEQLVDVPVLVLANKIDNPKAVSEDELRKHFGLYGQTSGKNMTRRSQIPGRPLELFMCSVLKQQGYGLGFRWLANFID